MGSTATDSTALALEDSHSHVCVKQVPIKLRIPERSSLSHQGQAEAAGGKVSLEPLLWFLQERTGKAGKAGLGLTALNNFKGLQGRGAVPSDGVPGPR